MGRPVGHFEIMGKDAEALQRFYRSAFDWTIRSVPGGIPYGLVKKEARGIGGGVGASSDGRPAVVVYVDVPDVDAALRKIQSLGGRVVMPTTVMPGMVTFAQFADPAGNVIGLSATAVPAKAAPKKRAVPARSRRAKTRPRR